jgi:hypothetical protein
MHKVFQAYDAMTAESLFSMKGTQKKNQSTMQSTRRNWSFGTGTYAQHTIPFPHSKRKDKACTTAYKVSAFCFAPIAGYAQMFTPQLC